MALAGRGQVNWPVNVPPNRRSMGLGMTSQRIAMMQVSDSKESAVAITDLVEPDGNPCGREVVIKLPLISR